MRHQVAYLRHNGITRETPILITKRGNKRHQICGDKITVAIRAMVCAAGPYIGFTEADINTRSLRGRGSMELLMAQVDPDTIYLLRMWWGNMMLRYLHTMAKSFTEGLSEKMFQHSTYTLIPTAHAGN